MFNVETSEESIRVLHLYNAPADALLGLHLKQLCRARNWSYLTRGMVDLTVLDLRPTDVVVLDFFARPLGHDVLRDELGLFMAHSEASFLLVFRRTFSSSVAPIHGMNCEYCFLGLDDIEEVSFRLNLVQNRNERFGRASSLDLVL